MEEPPPPSQKPSQIPSWVSLGFVLGALFVLALPRRASAPVPVPIEEPEPVQPRALAAPRLTTVEAVFAEWGKYASWTDGKTEIALWNAESKAYSDCFEVLQANGSYYFRSIPALTRPVLTHGVAENSPLEFTESEAQRRQWLGDVNREEIRAFSNGIKQAFGTPPPQTPPAH